jgi:hypothetical protein
VVQVRDSRGSEFWVDAHVSVEAQAFATESDAVTSQYVGCSEDGPDRPFAHLGSLRDFTSLEVLKISIFFLLGAPYGTAQLDLYIISEWWDKRRLPVRLSELLPPSLLHLEITNDFQVGENALVLNELADDFYQLPLLKTVHLDRSSGKFENLIAKFAVHDVCLTTHWDPNSSASNPVVW